MPPELSQLAAFTVDFGLIGENLDEPYALIVGRLAQVADGHDVFLMARFQCFLNGVLGVLSGAASSARRRALDEGARAQHQLHLLISLLILESEDQARACVWA